MASDITKTGGLNYKQLQAQNAAAYRKQAVQSIRMAGNVGYKPQNINIETDLGNSRYDDKNKEYNAADLENLEQLRWESQSTLDTIGNGIAKFAGKVGSTIIGTFAGIPAGIGTAISEGRWSGLWDNNVTQGMAEFDDFMEKNFKNYQSNNQQNASWLSWENFGSAKFWMDDVVTNAGFTVGAVLSGMMTGGIGGVGISLTRTAAAAAAKSVAGKGFLSVANALVKSAQIATKVGQKSSSLISSVVAATAEGSIEAKQAQKEYITNEGARIQEYFESEFAALDAKYAGNTNNAAYLRDKQLLEKRYKAANAQLQEEAREVGNRVLLGNQVLLTLGNVIQFGKSFSKSFENAARLELATSRAVGEGAIRNTGREFATAAERIGKQMAANGGKATSEMAAENGINLVAKKPFLGWVSPAFKGMITEGSEEMNQQWITSGAESQYANRHKSVDTYWKDRLNSKNRDVNDFLTEFGTAFADGFNKSWGDFDQWEQFLIGAMMGAGGMYMPTKIFNQDKTKKWYDPRRYDSYEGGMINELIDYNKQQSLRERNAKKLNELLATEKFWNHWYKEKQNLATAMAIQSRQEEHLAEGNKKAYKDDEDDYFAHVINTFARAGKLEDLKSIYNSHVNLSDEEIDNIVKQSTSKQNNSKALQAKATAIQSRIQNLLETKQNLIELQQEDLAHSGHSDITNSEINSYDTAILEAQQELEKVRNAPVEESFVGPYVDSNGDRLKTNDEIREELNHISDAFNQKVADYQEAMRRVQKDTRGKLNTEQEEALTYLAYKERSSLNRADKLYKNNPLIPRNITLANVVLDENKTLTKREEIRDFLKLNDNDITANNDGTFTINTSGMSVQRQRSLFTTILRDSKENTDLLNKYVESTAADNNITGEDFDNAVQDINDIFELEDSSSEYYAKLLEYKLDLLSIERDKNQAQEDANRQANRQAIQDQLGGKSLNDILNAMNNGELPTDLNIADIDDDMKSTYQEAQKIFKKYTSISDAIENSEADDAAKTLMHAILDDKLASATTVEDLTSINLAEISQVSKDDILDLTGFDSVEELAAAVGMADKVDASKPESLDDIVEDIKNGALEAMSEVLDEEEEKAKKHKAEPKKRTADEKKKDEKAEEEGESVGHDGGTKAKDTKGKNTYDLGEVVIAGKSRKVRATKVFQPGTKNVFTIKFQYDNEGKWQDAYIPIDASFFKDLNAKDGKNKNITLDSLSDKDGKIKVLSIKTDTYNGHVYHYAEIAGDKMKPKQAYYKGKHGKFNKAVRVILKSDASIDKMLGLEEGIVGNTKAKGIPLSVSKTRVVGNREDEQSVLNEAIDNAKKFNNQEQASIDKKSILKPQTTRFYIHPFQKSGNIFKPYWQIEDDLNRVAESERAESVYIDGKLVKISKRAAVHKAIHDFFLKNGVFDRQNQLKPGDEITFGFSKELNDSLPEGSDPILLMFDKDGNVVGDVASPIDERLFTSNTSIANLYKHSRNDNDNPREGSSDTTILMYSDSKGNVHPITTQVANRYIGTPQYGNENRPASEVLVTNNSEGQPIPDFELGVVMGDYSGNTIRTSNGTTVRTPANAVAGQPFILIHTSDPKRPWYPVSILMNTFNAESLKGTDFYKVLISHLSKIQDAAKNNKLKEFKDTLRNFLALSEDELFIAKNEDGSISIKVRGIEVSKVESDELLNNNQIAQRIAEDLSKTDQPIAINISKALFSKKFTIFDSEGNELTRDYKEIIGPLIYTNLESNHTVNDFFDTNPIEFGEDGSIKEGKATKLKAPKTSATRESRTPTADKPKNTVKGGYYYMDGKTIVVSDKDGKPIVVDKNTPQKDALNAAYTYILAQGFTEDGSYEVPYYGGRTLIVEGNKLSWGKDPISKNSETNKFVDKFQADQEKVDRDATDSEHYEIDGKYNVRLHARIDSLYGDNVSISKEQKNAMESIKRGLIKAFNDGVTIDNIISNYDAYLSFLDESVRQDIANKYAFEEEATPEQFIDEVMNAVRDKVTGMRGSRALKVGQAIDSAIRDFFLDPEKGLPEHNKYKGILSDNAYRQLRLALDQLYQQYGSKYSFISDKLVVNANIGGVDVAGELDLLAINKETGEVEIWDIKTSARSFINADGTLSDSFTSHGSKFARSSQEQYTIQLNAYKDMIKAKYGIDVVGLKILPLFVEYSDNGNGSQVAKITRQDLIPLEMRDGVLEEKKAKDGPSSAERVIITDANLDSEFGFRVVSGGTSEWRTASAENSKSVPKNVTSDGRALKDGLQKDSDSDWWLYKQPISGRGGDHILYAFKHKPTQAVIDLLTAQSSLAGLRGDIVKAMNDTSKDKNTPNAPSTNAPKTDIKWDEKTVRSQLLNSLGNTARGKKTLETIMPELLALDEETRDKIAKYLNAHTRISRLSTMLSKKIVPMLVEKSRSVGKNAHLEGATYRGTRITSNDIALLASARLGLDSTTAIHRVLSGLPILNSSRELFEKVIKVADNKGIRINFSNNRPSSDTAAEYNPNTKTVTMYIGPSHADFKTAFLHELIHGITLQIIRNPQGKKEQELRDTLEKCYKEALKYTNGQKFYGLNSLEEFVAELANPSFREYLKGIKLNHRTSLWQKIKDSLRKIFKNLLEVSDDTLDRILDYQAYDSSKSTTINTKTRRVLYNPKLSTKERISIAEALLNSKYSDREEGILAVFIPATGLWYVINTSPHKKNIIANLKEGRDGFEVLYKTNSRNTILNHAQELLGISHVNKVIRVDEISNIKNTNLKISKYRDLSSYEQETLNQCI